MCLKKSPVKSSKNVADRRWILVRCRVIAQRGRWRSRWPLSFSLHCYNTAVESDANEASFQKNLQHVCLHALLICSAILAQCCWTSFTIYIAYSAITSKSFCTSTFLSFLSCHLICSFSYAHIYLIHTGDKRKDSAVHLGICFSCAYANSRFEPLNLWFFEFVWFGLCSSCLFDDLFNNLSFSESPCQCKVSDSTYTICTKDQLGIHTSRKPCISFHAWAFSDVILNTPHNTTNMTPWLENPNRITLTHYITLIQASIQNQEPHILN